MTSPAPTLARTDVCPDCAAPLPGPTCARCGLELLGPTAVALLRASREADRWLGERRRLVQVLRQEAVVRQRARLRPPLPVPVAPAAATPAAAISSAAPAPAFPPPSGPPLRPAAPVRPARRPVLSVQSLLVGLGALLLAVASVVFLAFSWDRLGITGRSVVVATMTVAVLGGAVLARRARMQLTAEAVGALGAVLVVLDAVAVRATGVAGDQMGRLTYAATAALVCAAVLAGVARLGRLRAPGWAASALVPPAPALLGVHLALDAAPRDSPAWVAAGLLAAAVPAVLAGPLATRGARGEAAVLTWTGAAAAAAAAALLVVVAVWEPWQGAALAAGGAVLGLVHVLVPAGRAPRTWAAVAGASAAVAVALLATHLLDSWTLVGAPMGVGLLALALRLAAGTSVPLALVAARSALSVLAVVAAPAVATVVLHPVSVATAALQPWSAGVATSWAPASGADPGDWLPAGDSTASFVAVVAVVGVLAGWWRVSGSATARRAATVALAVVVVCVPWQADLPVLHVVATAVLLAAGAAAAGHALRRRQGWVAEGTTLLAAGAAVGALGVVAAWTVEPLSVPVTLLGVAGLVLARRGTGQVAFDVPAVAASLVTLGGAVAWTGARLADAALVATLAGAAVVAVASVAPRLTAGDRRAAAGTGVLAVLLSVVPAVAAPVVQREPRLLLVLLAGVLAATAAAADPRRVWSAGERAAGAAVLVPLVALAAAGAVRVGGRTVGALDRVDPALAAAVVVAAALAAAASLHRGRRVLAPVVEASAAVCGAAVLGVALARLGGLPGAGAEASWPLLVVLAVGAAALAVEPSRRWVAWVALVLASGALWDRLAAADVGTVEAFSLPPAAVLLGAAVVTARRDGVVARPSTVAGLALLVLPTAVASVGGPAVRPAALLVAAGLAVAVAHVLLRTAPAGRARTEAAGLLLAGAGAGVLAGPVLRSLAGGGLVEGWSVPSALVLLGGAATLARVPGAAPAVPWVVLAPLLVATVPTLAAGEQGPTWAGLARHLAVLATGAAVLLHGCRATRLAPAASGALVVLATGVALGAGRGLVGPVELLTVPAAAALAVAGAARMRVRPEQGSWPWWGPAAALALLPTLLLASTGGPVLRTVLLGAGAAAVLLLGVRQGRQAPVVVGAVVLAVHAVVQLSPFVALAYQAVPRWASLALVGLVLLALGARYEARVRDVVSLRRRVATLR